MHPTSKTLATLIVASIALAASAAEAQVTATTSSLPSTTHPSSSTTTTTPTTTTTTTLDVHPFSPATAECIRLAKRHSRSCTDGSDACRAKFGNDFSNCFAVGAGVRCASTCFGRETTCLQVAPLGVRACRRACRLTKARDIRSCHTIAADPAIWASGDQGCLQTAFANFDLCKFACTQPALDCVTNFGFCIADCPNL